MSTHQQLNKVTDIITGLNILPETLNTFQFIPKAPTQNQAWSLLSGYDLSGYLIAEQINAIRDIVSALVQVTDDVVPVVNTLINNPNNYMHTTTPQFYTIENADPLKERICDFTNIKNTLSVESVLDFPDILQVNVETSQNILYFPTISMYKIVTNIDNPYEYQLLPTEFPQRSIITFQIWIRITGESKISSVSLPSQYLLLDNEEAFPSELTNISLDESCSTVYVFPVRISNLENKAYPDVQISYAYRFKAGLNNQIGSPTIIDNTIPNTQDNLIITEDDLITEDDTTDTTDTESNMNMGEI